MFTYIFDNWTCGINHDKQEFHYGFSHHFRRYANRLEAVGTVYDCNGKQLRHNIRYAESLGYRIVIL